MADQKMYMEQLEIEHLGLEFDKTFLMQKFLKRIVDNDRQAKKLFYLYYDRHEISEQQFFHSIRHFQ